MSGVGDETNWIEDANIDSSAKFLEVGYKDGGSLVGMIGVLGQYEVQNIQATNVYGNLKPQNLALPVASEIKKVAGNSLLRYIPKLNQIWILNGEEIFIVKPDRLSKLDEKIFQDSGFGVELSRGEILIGKVKVNLSLQESGSSTRRRLIPDDDCLTVLAQNRNVYRNKFLDVTGSGSAGGIIFNSIILDVVNV